MTSSYKMADLDSTKIEALQKLEKSVGKVAVAFEPAPELAELNASQLSDLQRTEQELGIVLLAYEPNS